jgi:cation/acetate symporter
VGLAFAVAASANLPVILFSLFWKRFNTAGALWGLGAGLTSSIVLIMLSPSVRGPGAPFPLDNPGIVSIPIGIVAAWLGTLASKDRASEEKYPELLVRSQTGIGAEKASNH